MVHDAGCDLGMVYLDWQVATTEWSPLGVVSVFLSFITNPFITSF